MHVRLLLLTLTAALAAQAVLPSPGGRHLAFGVEMANVFRTGRSEGPQHTAAITLPDLTVRTYHLSYVAALKSHPALALRFEGFLGSGVDSTIWKDKVIPEPGAADGIGLHDIAVVERHSFRGLGLELLGFRPLSRTLYPFLFAGLNAKSYAYRESWTIRDATGYDGTTVSSDFPFESTRLAFEPTAGTGFFLRLGRNVMLALQYRCRYSTPVEYPEGILGTGFTMTQTLLSHGGEAGLNFRL